MLTLRIPVLAIVGGHEAPSPIVAAVGQVAHCSATLIAPTIVLTSAHCLSAPVDRVILNGHEVAVTVCERHPAYQPGQADNDLGYCRLATSVAGALPLDTEFEPSAGDGVTLAGFGASAPVAREKPTLRVVSTSVVRADGDRLDVGTTTATGCRGDSGGPVLTEQRGIHSVVGIIEGAQGAICASPARAVPLHSQRDWVRSVLASAPEGHAKHIALALALTLLAGAGMLAFRRRRSAARSG